MANLFEALLSDDEIRDPAAIAAALRRQQKLGTLGQLMGVAPTREVGGQMVEGAQTSLRSAMAKQQAAKEAAARAEERKQAQANWQAQMEREQARDAEQRRQFAIQEQRLGRSQDAETKAQWQSAVDPVTGAMRLYNKYTGEWKDEVGGTPPSAQPQQSGGPAGFPGMPAGGGKALTEGQNKNFLGTSTMATTLPTVERLVAQGWGPSQIDKFAAGPMLPGWQKVIQGVTPRSFASKEGEEYFAAGRQIVGAILRPESGGAITEDEWTEYGPQWLPWPGDSFELRQEKVKRLQNRMDAMGLNTGPAARYYQRPQPGGTPQAQGVSPQGSGRNFEAEYGLGGQ